jgi:hypothetical protein
MVHTQYQASRSDSRSTLVAVNGGLAPISGGRHQEFGGAASATLPYQEDISFSKDLKWGRVAMPEMISLGKKGMGRLV